MSRSPTIASISIATPRLRSSRLSLDSLIIDDERVIPKPDDSTKMIRPNQGRWLSPFFQAASDLRSSNLNWKLWIITVLLAVGFMLTLSLLLMSTLYGEYWVSVGCGINGFFSPFRTQPNRLAISQFFQINIGLGSLTFTEAKVIDIIWDSVVGRVGQVCLALVSWRVFADCATVSLTTRPLSFTAFHTIFLDSEPSIFSAWNVTKSFISQKRLASKVVSAFIIFTMFFILAWPTLASAATGYVPITRAVVREQLEGGKTDPNLIAFSGFQHVAYIIHDFWRINTLNTSLIVYNTLYPCDLLDFPESSSSCSLIWSVSNYTSEYGFYGLSNKSSRFMDVQLEPPALNIEACSVLPPSDHYYYGEHVLYGRDWIDPRNQSGSFRPFNDVSRNAWAYSNKTYYLADIIAGGSCTPETDVGCVPSILK
ncbi:hypothetical protein NUW58_g3113 [Xylaria curta]|uniref:Uncharacterized protein n=1 Tax=Xylaria curta TaxID=42375 RepID=A0ACC1PDN8_9PEZI|nr:hypothetical protein NUW58_g3113 [Xylaria curta]